MLTLFEFAGTEQINANVELPNDKDSNPWGDNGP